MTLVAPRTRLPASHSTALPWLPAMLLPCEELPRAPLPLPLNGPPSWLPALLGRGCSLFGSVACICAGAGRQQSSRRCLILKHNIVGHGRRQHSNYTSAVSQHGALAMKCPCRRAVIQAASAHTFLSSVTCAPSPEAVAATSVRPGFSVTIDACSVAVLIRLLRRRRFHVAVGICRGTDRDQKTYTCPS